MEKSEHQSSTSSQICVGLVPRLDGLGGPSTFNQNLIAGLAARGIRVTHNLDDPAVRAVLVNGGTRHLDWLARARHRGLRVVQRLDGLNWVQRKRWPGLRLFLRSEANNSLLSLIRSHLTDAIIYQSAYSRSLWEREYGPIKKPVSVVLNGVDLESYNPAGPGDLPTDRIRIQAVEGHWGVGNGQGLRNALDFARVLASRLDRPVELCVAGDVPEALRLACPPVQGVDVNWVGIIPREQIPEKHRSAHLFFSAEIMAPCPNAVIEALACGLPVVAYETGSLAELVQGEAGRVVPYGDDAWSLCPARPEALVNAAMELLANLPAARRAARKRAETVFNLPDMVDQYSRVLLGEG